MELSPEELDKMQTLKDAAAWAGLASGPKDALFAHLGVSDTTPVRNIGILSKDDFEKILMSWLIPAPTPADATATVTPSANQFGQAGLVGRACRVKCGTEQNSPAHLGASSVLSTPPVKKVKLGSIIEQTNDNEQNLLDSGSIQAAFERYKKSFGDFPPAEEEPTGDQLTALKAVVDAQGPPYADFGIWGPHGYRILKKIKMRGLRISPSGELATVELAGPGSFEQWDACFRVFRSAAVMLNMLSPSKCEAYMNLIRKYNTKYGHKCWHIIYQADVRARQEHWERCRREAAEEHCKANAAGQTHAFDVSKPWEYALMLLINDFRLWKDELEDPCILVMTKMNAANTLPDDGKRDPSDAARLKDAGVKLRPEDRNHNVVDGKYTTNRRGVRLCDGFNAGECKDHDKFGRCARDASKVHQCNICLSTGHTGSTCTKPPPEAYGKGRGKGKKGGKSKSR